MLMKNIISAAIMLCLSVCCAAQYTITGVVVDKQNGEPIIGGAVMEAGTTNGTVTDLDGRFSLRLAASPATIQISFLGYQTLEMSVQQKGSQVNLGDIALDIDSKALEDVVVVSSIAVARKTPVAMSSLDATVIDEKLGTQEFPEVLKSTPGVHANKQGGGYGDSEIYMRGFDNTNIATMINGVPMNDMENGTVYWSNWAGLADVTRSMQTQRGLGASKVSAPSVGGTINIVTKGIDSKKGGHIYYALGNDNMNKILFTVSSGMNERGWAFTILGAKNWGDGYVQGTDFEGYNYFINISKRINDKHQLSLTAFGAPQEHYQRSASYGSLTIENWKMVEKTYGVKDYKFNASYGFDKNGQRKTSDYNQYHKPQISLNHQWQISDKANLSSSVYVSIGRGNGYSGEGNENYGYSYTAFRGAQYGQLLTTYRKSDGTFDYGAIQEINENSEYGSMLIMTKSKNYHDWYGLLSTYSDTFFDLIDFYGGIDFRYYKGTHTNEIIDLYGGEYYMDSCRGDVSATNNSKAGDSEWLYEKLGVGDVVYRDYDGFVMQEGGFFQAEYSKEALTAFVSGSLSNTTYWRKDRFYYDKEHAESDKVNFLGFTAKGGANYNLNDYHNVFANIGYISRAPKYSYGAFLSSTTSNAINEEAENEKIFSVEIGYGFKSTWLSANVNAYITKWMDKTMTKSGTMDNQTEYYMNMTGVDALHKGIEIDLKSQPLTWLELSGMLSLGDWKWNSNATGYAYDEYGNALNEDGAKTEIGADDHAYASIDLDGVRVGGSAQTTAAIGLTVKPMEGLRIGLDWTYYARNYAYYSFSGSNLSLGKTVSILDPWKIPDASQFDLNASYKFDLGSDLKATISGNVNNLFDYQYISKAYNPSTIVSSSYSQATADNIYCYFAFGRTYSVRLKVQF